MSQYWNYGRLVMLLVFVTGSSLLLLGCEQPLSMIGFLGAPHASHGATNQAEGPASVETNSDSKTNDTPLASDLVKDWEKPAFAIFYGGRQHGYIEPCGCTGLTNQKGGLMRRHTVQKILEDRGWDLVKIDTGDQIDRFGQQPTLKLKKTFESICKVMKYDAVGLGIDDLRTSSDDLSNAMLDNDYDQAIFTSANIEIVDPSLTPPIRIIERNGKRIGVTMVMGDEQIAELNQYPLKDITLKPAVASLTEIAPQMIAADCDLKILVVTASLEDSRALAKQFPIFDLIITNGCAGDPTLLPEEIPLSNGKSSLMVQVGVKGMYVGIVAFYENDGKPTLKYERVPLDGRFADSEEIKQVFISYQEQLKRWWLAGELADIKPRPHPSGNKFIGSSACADCHDEEYAIWEDGNSGDGGPHSHATKSLTDPNERSWVQRNYDPECVSCHMTGWNPQEYYPYQSGYLDAKADDHLFNNGCENCHGPGSAHVAAEEDSADEATLTKLREQMRVTVAQARETACVQCHDLDNSPDYVKDETGFDRYWPEIKH